MAEEEDEEITSLHSLSITLFVSRETVGEKKEQIYHKDYEMRIKRKRDECKWCKKKKKEVVVFGFIFNNNNNNKLNGFRVGYGYPWIIYSGKIRVWILMGIDIRVSMGKLFG